MLNIAIICGGVSKERGISLNSARSFLDHTSSLSFHLTLLYINPEGSYYKLTPSQLYSNTPSDFDFKLPKTSRIEEEALISFLKTMDLVFPLMHGAFGENGTLQKFLETHNIPFVGSSSEACKRVFNKYEAKQLLAKEGFSTLPALRIQSKEDSMESFWKEHHLTDAVLKPTESGSSIGVTYVSSLSSAKKALMDLWEQGFHELLLEPYSQDIEFTVCVLENPEGDPVSLIPLEIDIGHEIGALLDFRRKYLPSEETRYYCPPRFSEDLVSRIRYSAELLFKKFGLRDFVRIDGWISKTGEIQFSDFNPISGMEQNSFLFQQAARAEMSHTDLIQYILNNALKRYRRQEFVTQTVCDKKEATPIYVLMGGSTAERQVSLMSGTNVWLKLRQEPRYEATPFLLDEHKQVWKLPYAYTLHHTVEEIKEHCLSPKQPYYETLKHLIRKQLKLSPSLLNSNPILMTLDTFLESALQENAFVFLALHGGVGEDGTIQKILELKQIPFNGSNSTTSEICMDKKETALLIGTLNNPMILPMKQLSFELSSLKQENEIKHLWQEATSYFGTNDLLIKPQCDGCSAGVLRVQSSIEFMRYITCCHKGHKTFKHEHGVIEMPSYSDYFLLEPFIHTDRISICGTQLHHEYINGWCEMTIGVFEREGLYLAFPPSITVSTHHILSLEEKFQGGTGINITPPPENILSAEALNQVKESVCSVAKILKIKNYARLDLFVECKTGVIQIIEANTLPALTPSTVIFHQALHNSPPLYPKELLSLIIENASSYRENVLYSCQI